MENIGVFVAGGPAAGINGVIKGIVQEADNHEIRVHGFQDGCEGLIDDRHVLLTRELVEDIHVMGGSILGTSRFNPLTVERILETLRRHAIDGLVAIGGEGTLQLADLLRRNGVPIVHVPKTIDNDIHGIPQTFGFDTAVNEASRLLGAIGFLLNDETIGCMVSIVDDRLVPVPIEQVAGRTKSVNLAGVRYLALKESERYESCRAGLLMRKRPPAGD